MRGQDRDEGLGDTVTGIINQMSYRDTERDSRGDRREGLVGQPGRSIYTITTGHNSSSPGLNIN